MIVLRFFVFAVAACAAFKLPVELNIGNINEDLFDVEPLDSGVNYDEVRVKPKSKYILRRVSYGDDNIWDEQGKDCTEVQMLKGGDSIEAVKLVIVGGNGQTESVFAKKIDGSIVIVSEEDFNTAVEEWKKGASSIPVKLDIQQEGESSIFKLKEQVLDGLDVVSFTPKGNYAFDSVFDGEEPIWEPSGSETSSLVALRKFKGEVHLLSLETQGEALYFEKVNGEWKHVDKGTFDEASKKLKSSIETVEQLDFDVTQPADEEKFQVTHKSKGGLRTATANSRAGYQVTKVKFGDSVIWMGFDGETAGSVAIGWQGPTVKLVSIKLFADHTFKKLLYYKNVDGEFQAVTRDDFNSTASDIIKERDADDSTDETGSISGSVFSSIVSEKQSPDGEDIDLDISQSADYDRVLVSVGQENDISFSDFMPRGNSTISNVHVGEEPVWKAEKNERCKHVTAYYISEKPKYLKLYLVGKKDPILYGNSKGSWRSLSKRQFDSQLEISAKEVKQAEAKKLQGEQQVEETEDKAPKGALFGFKFGKRERESKEEEQTTPLFKLDLSNPNDAQVRVSKFISVGFETVRCTALPGHAIGEVINGFQAVWNGEGKAKCTESILYYKYGVAKYLILTIDGKKYHFMKMGANISAVEQSEFELAFTADVQTDAILKSEVYLGENVEL